MQTFLPYASFSASAAILDRQRLGKQRVEVLQILRALMDSSSGWRSHPAVRMWRGYESALVRYGQAICGEWMWRGYRDSVRDKIRAWRVNIPVGGDPHWLGYEEFHRSHRSNLLRKAPEHYAGLPGFDVPDDLPYVWPEGAP